MRLVPTQFTSQKPATPFPREQTLRLAEFKQCQKEADWTCKQDVHFSLKCGITQSLL